MRRLIIFTFFLMPGIFGNAQQTNLDITGYTTLQTFRGKASVNYTYVNKHAIYPRGTANDRFGHYSDAGYGIAFTLQRITKKGLLFGLSTGTEILKNKIKLDWIYTISGRIPAHGKVSFSSRYLNIVPIAGYRFKIHKNYNLDLQAMAEFALPVSRRNGIGRAYPEDGSQSIVVGNWDDKQHDIRTGLMFAINRKKFSLTGSWSSGFVNFMSSFIGSNEEAYANVYRLGIRYTWIGNHEKKKPVQQK